MSDLRSQDLASEGRNNMSGSGLQLHKTHAIYDITVYQDTGKYL